MADWVDGLAERRREDDGFAFVLRTLADGWSMVLAGAALGFMAAVLLLRAIPPEHTAAMVVGPISPVGAAAMGARVPAYGREAASVAEHGSGEESLSDYARFLHLLTSPAVAGRLLAEPGLPERLFADRWDPATGQWRPAEGPAALLRRTILALVGREDWSMPDAQVLARHLRRMVVVETVGTSPMRRITLRHRDPAFAVHVLERLGRITDAHLREEARRRVATQIGHVRDRLAALRVEEHRRALLDLVADHERVLMMLAVDLPFAADPVEPPAAAAQPDWPDPATVLTAFTAAGLFLGLLAAGASSLWRRRWRRDA